MPYSRHVGYLCPGITLSRRVITGRHAAPAFLLCLYLHSLPFSLWFCTLAPICFYTERTHRADESEYKYKTRRTRESSYRELSTLTYGM